MGKPDQTGKPVLGLHNIPSVLLVKIGRFLTAGDILRAVRTCKTPGNQAMKPMLESVTEAQIGYEQRLYDDGSKVDEELMGRAQVKACLEFARLRHLTVGGLLSPPLLRPLFTSNIGDFLKELEIVGVDLVLDQGWKSMIPSCTSSLQVLTLSLCQGLDDFRDPLRGKRFQSLTLHLPPTLRSLTLVQFTAVIAEHLLACITEGEGLPELEELHLYGLELYGWRDAEAIGQALRGSVGQSLKFLTITGPKDTFVSRMLSLYMDTPPEGAFTRLSKLVIDEVCWDKLGLHFLKGAFPKLNELVTYDPGSSFWYETDCRTIRIWIQVMRGRSLKAWGGNGFLCFQYDNDNRRNLGLLKELLIGLSEPLDPRSISSISHLELDAIGLDDEGCQALATAITVGNFGFVQSMGFRCNTFNAESFRAIGRSLNDEFLPALSSLRIYGMRSEDSDYYDENDEEDEEGDLANLYCWRSLFKAIPAHGLKGIRKLSIISPSAGSVELLFHALSRLHVSVFSHLSIVSIHGSISNGDICGMSAALYAEAFPNLEQWSFCGDSYYDTVIGNPSIVAKFFKDLSRHSNIKTLSLGHLSESLEMQLFRVGLDLVLASLYSSSPEKCFPSLETVECICSSERGDRIWEKEIIEHCRQFMMARAPVHLKSLRLNDRYFTL